MGQLAGGVAHDFNNQLAAILGFAELLQARDQDPDRRRWTAAIAAAAQRSASLTRQLLAFARRGEAQEAPVDVHQAAREALELARVGLGPRIRVEEVLRAARAVVLGDPGLLQNAVLNLLLNARDALPGGGVLRLESRLDRPAASRDPRTADLPDAEHLVLTVADTGEGMAEPVLARLFEPFFTTKPVGRGTGLGLAAVWGTVQRMRGAVEVASTPGRGSSFSLWLPLAQEPLRPTPSRPRPAQAGGTLLVVDDEPAVRSLLAEQLRGLGYAVAEAADARAGVAAWREHRPRLVLLDLVMPEGGGAAAFESIRAEDPAAAVLIVSGFSHEGEVQRLLAAGAAGFLQKPFTARELAEALARIIPA
jgi:CheY-like chemotaxis protein